MSTASHTCGSSRLVGTVPVWPPPSAPCAITASTPQRRDLLGVAPRADRRHHDDARVLERLHQPLARRLGEARDLHALAHHERDAVVDVGLVRAQVHAERVVGAALAPRGSPCVSSSKVIVALARMPRPPAALVADGEPRARRPSPSPSARSGARTPNSSVAAAQRRVRHADLLRSRVRDFLLAEAVSGRGPRGSARYSSGVGARVSGTSSGTTSSKPVAATISSTVTPGCTEWSRIVWSGVSKSRTPRLVTTWRMWWKRAGRAERGGAVVPDAADDVDLLARTPGSSGSGSSSSWCSGSCCPARRGSRAAAPSAGPTTPTNAKFWLPYRSICDAAHHHVPPTRPHDVEHRPVRVPRLDDLGLVGRADRVRDRR